MIGPLFVRIEVHSRRSKQNIAILDGIEMNYIRRKCEQGLQSIKCTAPAAKVQILYLLWLRPHLYREVDALLHNCK